MKKLIVVLLLLGSQALCADYVVVQSDQNTIEYETFTQTYSEALSLAKQIKNGDKESRVCIFQLFETEEGEILAISKNWNGDRYIK